MSSPLQDARSYRKVIVFLKVWIFILPLLSWAKPESVEESPRPYFNEQRCPKSIEDLVAIQEKLKVSFEGIRASVVSVKLENGFGSGVLVSKSGLVLTAAHVIDLPDTKLTIVTEDGTEYPAKALGLDSDTDCAMIQIDEIDHSFPYVPVDFDGKTRVGDWVFSVGHSGGFDKERGNVLRLGRVIRTSETVILTDNILIGGDSGGALFDINGVLIGIHSRVGNPKAINFHVPLHIFDRHWDSLLNGEFLGNGPYAERPKKGSGFLGVGVEEQGDSIGLLVIRVVKESAAEKAGVKVGDRIVTINGIKVGSKTKLVETISKYATGKQIELILSRDNEKITMDIKLGRRK